MRMPRSTRGEAREGSIGSDSLTSSNCCRWATWAQLVHRVESCYEASWQVARAGDRTTTDGDITHSVRERFPLAKLPRAGDRTDKVHDQPGCKSTRRVLDVEAWDDLYKVASDDSPFRSDAPEQVCHLVVSQAAKRRSPHAGRDSRVE